MGDREGEGVGKGLREMGKGYMGMGCMGMTRECKGKGKGCTGTEIGRASCRERVFNWV